MNENIYRGGSEQNSLRDSHLPKTKFNVRPLYRFLYKSKACLRLDYLYHIKRVLRAASGIANGDTLTHAAGKVKDESSDNKTEPENDTVMSLASD